MYYVVTRVPVTFFCITNTIILAGRLLGLSLLHGDIFPISFSRHVLKFLLGRKIGWHDLAFFDGALYEGLRKLLLLVSEKPEAIPSLEQHFEVYIYVCLCSGARNREEEDSFKLLYSCAIAYIDMYTHKAPVSDIAAQ